MKKLLLPMMALILLDQAIKLYLAYCFPAGFIEIIPGFLCVFPFKNTNLGWLGGVLHYKSPVWLNVLTQALILLLAFTVYRYFSFVVKRRSARLSAMLTLVLAAAPCASVDVLVWGGSWDFICFFENYILDLKDIYIVAALLLLLSFSAALLPIYAGQSKEHKKSTGFRSWVSKGFPPE